jgi:hypothetical protein
MLEGNREMDDVKIKVFKLKILQRFLESFLNIIGMVISAPKLGDDEQIFTLNSTSLNGAFNAFTDLFLVSVISGTIEKSVSSLNSSDNDVSTDILGKLPETKSTLRHLDSRSEGKAGLACRKCLFNH